MEKVAHLSWKVTFANWRPWFSNVIFAVERLVGCYLDMAVEDLRKCAKQVKDLTPDYADYIDDQKFSNKIPSRNCSTTYPKLC